MASFNLELQRNNGTTLDTIYLKTDLASVNGLMDGLTIDRSILPTATDSVLGAVKLSNNYNPTTPAADTVLNQTGAKALYELIKNLESPFDYITSIDRAWDALTQQSTVNTYLNTLCDTHTGSAPHPGHAYLINNTGSESSYFTYSVGSVTTETSGYWLWVYDGVNWVPSVEFPEVLPASYTAETLELMVEGIITKDMLWKLKNIETGAQVNPSFETSTSNIKMNGTVSVGTSDKVARADHIHATDTSRASSTHVHGSITNDGKIGSTANLPIITGTSGVLQVGSFGDTANTFCQGNDYRLSNARTPTSHTDDAGIYGMATTGLYGHVKIVEGLATATATNGLVLGAYQGKLLNDAIAGKAPTSHASAATTYGVATADNYGHVKIGTNISVSTGTISVANASETVKGVVELATTAEAQAGSSTSLVLTAATGKSLVDYFASIPVYLPTELPAASSLPVGKLILVGTL
jgi:hypothetical protein